MNEPFKTPDGADDWIIECEGCENLLYISANKAQEISPCPLCGCLNDINGDEEPNIEIQGRLILKSPILQMNKNSIEKGKITLPELPDRVQDALLWLQEHQWRFGFTVENEEE